MGLDAEEAISVSLLSRRVVASFSGGARAPEWNRLQLDISIAFLRVIGATWNKKRYIER